MDIRRYERRAPHYEVQRKVSKNEKTNFRMSIIVNEKYGEYQQEFLSVPERYQTIRNSCVGQIISAKRSVDFIDRGTPSSTEGELEGEA